MLSNCQAMYCYYDVGNLDYLIIILYACACGSLEASSLRYVCMPLVMFHIHQIFRAQDTEYISSLRQ